MTVEIAVLDLAGTTIADDGLVVRAFDAAYPATGLPDDRRSWADEYVAHTMGQSKISVFRHLTGGDENQAAAANAAFERAYGSFVADGLVAPIDGAAAAIDTLRSAGVKVALVTGFSPATRDALLAAVGWQEIADLVLSPSDVGRGRPFPDLVLGAVLRLGGTAVARVAVVGDTPSDMATGVAAGAGHIVGVLSGGQSEQSLRDAGATSVLDSIAALPELLLK